MIRSIGDSQILPQLPESEQTPQQMLSADGATQDDDWICLQYMKQCCIL